MYEKGTSRRAAGCGSRLRADLIVDLRRPEPEKEFGGWDCSQPPAVTTSATPPHRRARVSSRLVLGGSRRTVHPHTLRGLAESLAAADGKIRVRTHLILPVSRKPPPPHSPGPLRLLLHEHPLVVPQFMHL